MPGGIHPPISVVATWPEPNFINPETHGWQLSITSIVLCIIAILTVCLRLYARLVVVRQSGWDDYLIVISLVPAISIAVAAILPEQKYGFNRHVWDLTIETAVKGRKIAVAQQAIYVATSTLIKLSILALLLRITNGVNRYYRYAVCTTIAVVISYFIIFEVTLFTGCQPLNAYWHEVDPAWEYANVGKYHCDNEAADIMGATVVAILTDFATFVLPLILFRKLQVPFKQKFALGFVFGLGLFLCIAGIMRLIVTYQTFYSTYDVTWVGQKIFLWTSVEIFGGIVCASIPSLKILFGRYFDGTTRPSGKYYVDVTEGTAQSSNSARKGRRGSAFLASATRDEGEDIELGKDFRISVTAPLPPLDQTSIESPHSSHKTGLRTMYEEDSIDERTSHMKPVPTALPPMHKPRYEVWETR